MAIQFRIRLLFALRLLLLNGSILSERINQDLRANPIKFNSQNPSHITASALKNSHIYLHCNVSADVDESLTKDLSEKQIYATDIDEEEDEDENSNYDPIEVKKLYQKQNKDYNKEKINNNDLSDLNISNLQLQNRNNNKNGFMYYNSIRRSRREASHEVILYEWLRNDNSNIFISINDSNQVINHNGYLLFPNGTLKFQVTNLTTGVYRCQATFVNNQHDFDIGPIVSTASNVQLATLTNDPSERKSITVLEGHSVVIICPINSIPEATFSWSFNDEKINFNVGLKESRRHYLLRNGSLLIVNTRQSDSGKYLCNAANQFTRKLSQNSTILTVMSRTDNDEDDGERKNVLLPQLQSSIQKIKSGQNLVLHCAGNAKKISWTFLPRNANQTIPLPEFNNELRYVNVSMEKHDGIYNCSIENDSQIFDVVIMTQPIIVSKQTSKSSSVPISIQFNCSAIGNPKPEIIWYKNGKLIENTHIIHARNEILRIETLEFKDEGLYQCFARNDFGEASGAYYLHLPPRNLLNSAPVNAKCYSSGNNIITVEFQRNEFEHINKIQYSIATDEPRDFITNFSVDLLGKNSFELSKSSVGIAKTLKPFYLYLRSMMPMGPSLAISPLSKEFVCAFQEIEPKFVKSDKGTFLTWYINDLSYEELSKAVITIQFLKNDTDNAVQFTNEAIGTYAHWNEELPQWKDVEKNLQKISVNSSDQGQWTEVKVTGNITGILIIKVEEIFVRIFGSIDENGHELQQNYSQVKWKSVKTTFAPLTVSEIESRSVIISWSGLDDNNKCLKACTFLKQETLVSLRDSKSKTRCEQISDPSAKIFYIRTLLPTSNYDVYIKDCNENYVSTAVNFQTLRDVPGPVGDYRLTLDANELVLHWEPPKNPNGEIFYYIITWTINNVTYEENVTSLFFRFPNTKNGDKFYIVVKAVGEGGVGNPLILDPKRTEMYKFEIITPMPTTLAIDQLAVFFVIVVSIVLIILTLLLILCRRYRYCKKNNGIINEQQSSFSPTTSPVMDNMKTDEMYEMQTLIPASQNSSATANGRENNVKATENISNGGVILSANENQNILRTSTPTEELTTMTEVCDEPPIKCDTESTIQITDERKPNGLLLKTFQAMAPNIVMNKTPEKILLKVNGNSSPYKCLQSSINDQNSSSECSSFGSNHRHQLIDINSLCNGLNNNNNNNVNNNSNHHNNSSSDRSKIGKSSSIETDNDDEDSEENLHEYDLNDSNLSSKPLHPISGWSFRQQIVGPNG
ncbi:hypothetical protein PVAND_002397 [Polypedilum vanderplanki]|uniref:Uncharacterized protein n=1 Tax=Polypedilum vanderplanki TaxID=319348 RepID=A0A9J6BRB8_POLVA|nr:hypothetical protein PVAND_002397 [Polypedilum vanderplanki]